MTSIEAAPLGMPGNPISPSGIVPPQPSGFIPDINPTTLGFTSTHTDETNRRVYQLLSQGHQWMGLQTLYALADSGINDTDLSYLSERMRTATVQGVQASLLQPGLIGAKQTVDYQSKATAYLDTQMGRPKTDIKMPGAKRPRTIPEQEDQTNQRRKYIQSVRDKTKNPDDGFKHLFDDPVLQKNPSAGLALARYLNGVLGPVPIKEPHLVHIQQQLQLQGYGRDLKADGTMSPEWNAATNAWKNDIYKTQLAGNKPGSISFGHAMQALQALMPTSAWDALLGYAKAFTGGARQLLGDAVGSTVTLGADLVDPKYWTTGQSQNLQAGYATTAAVENVLGGDTTTKKVAHQYTDAGASLLFNDMTNLIMMASVLGSAGKFYNAVGIERAATTDATIAAQLTKDAAFQGPGVIAKSLAGLTGVNPAIPRAVAGGVLGAGGTALAGGTPAQIGLGGLAGGALGGLSSTDAFQNIPILGRTGPFIEHLADADGLYYKVREFVHSPYTWVGGAGGAGPVPAAIGIAARLGDTAFNQSLLLGAEARGTAQAQQWVSPTGQSPLSRSIDNTHSVDALNDAIKHRLDFTILGAHIQPSINDLMFVFGGKGAAALHTTNSQILEGNAQTVSDAVTSALGDPGYAASIQRATASGNVFKTTPTLTQLIERAGGQTEFNEFWGAKIVEASVAWAAENKLATEHAEAGVGALGDLASQSRAERLMELEHEILHDPEQLDKALSGLRAQHGGEELTVRLKRDIAYGAMSTRGPQNNLSAFIDAQRFFRDNVHPTHADPEAWANQVSDPHNFGFASTSRLSRQQANVAINDFSGELNDLEYRSHITPDTVPVDDYHRTLIAQGRPLPEEQAALESEMFDFLHKKIGVSGRDMPERGAAMIDRMRDQTRLLGADVHLHPDAPPLLVEQVDELRRHGYKPFTGTDIGYHIVNTPTVDATEGPLGFVNRVVEHAGLNPRTIPNAPLGTHLWTDSVNAIQAAIDRGEIVLPPGTDATTIMAYLQHEGAVEGKRWTPVEVIGGFGARKAARDQEISLSEAQDAIDNFPVQFRDWSRPKFVDTLSGKKAAQRWADSTEGAGSAAEMGRIAGPDMPLAPPMTRAHAERAYQILVDAAVPDGYYAGAAKVEDIFRALGDGPLGRILPNNRAGWAMANLPNALIQLRNDLRFDLSPAFSFRRWFKSGIKAAVEGIPPVWDPVHAMNREGTLHDSLDVYERVRPGTQKSLEYLDSGSRYLKSQDVFGLYNGAMTEARAAGIWSRAGRTDEEIDRLLTRTFEYGNKTVAGRSALERTTNFVFFPFSFEKTVIRNLGGYLLDAPAQRLLMTRALAAYDDFNKHHLDGSNPLATAFWTKHAPILNEAAQLNAFSHGLSLGEPGGINRPLLNLFLPQSWNADQGSVDALHRFVPAIKDFERVVGEIGNQGAIVSNEAQNALDDVREQYFGNKNLAPTYAPGGATDSPGPRRSTLTTQADIDAGFAMQQAWIHDNAATIDHNSHIRGDANKLKFPLDRVWGRLAGQPITAQSIREIVGYAHPAFKAEAAITVAVTNDANWKNYLLDQQGKRLNDGTPKYQYLLNLQTQIKNLVKLSVSKNLTTDQMVKATDNLRAASIFVAEQDPEFFALYTKTFQKYLGPLERVAQ